MSLSGVTQRKEKVGVSLRRSERIEREAMDRLSDLPDRVLLHIMTFMNAKNAVQTCLLSKRWKDLWKRLTDLTLHSSDFSRRSSFTKFMYSVLSRRVDSISLHNLNLCVSSCFPYLEGCIHIKLPNRVMTYAALHDVQQLIIDVSLKYDKDFELPSRIFYCRSLTFLELSFWHTSCCKIKLPKSLDLPALKSLHLLCVTFSTIDSGCAQPFSNCNMLNTLVIKQCDLQDDAKVLCISNSKLSNLTIIFYSSGEDFTIMLSTPNLSLLNIKGDPMFQSSSVCNLPLLEQVNINLISLFDSEMTGLVMVSWLQVLVYVKILTLSRWTLTILDDLSSCSSVRTQLPCFARLKSLKLDPDIPDEIVSRVVEYLLQNSQLTRVDIIKCPK